jgi:hypothetical protein
VLPSIPGEEATGAAPSKGDPDHQRCSRQREHHEQGDRDMERNVCVCV